jgi:hypothetical protein
METNVHYRVHNSLPLVPNLSHINPLRLHYMYISKISFNIILLSQNQTQNYFTTEGQSARLSWFQAPIWLLRPDCYFC